MAKIRRRRFPTLDVPGDFTDRLLRVAEAAGLFPRGGEPLACAVRAASALYVGQRGEIARKSGETDILAARLLFYLVRDFSKVVAPLTELRALGWQVEGPRLRVLDVGAGVGASTLGVARFAASCGIEAVDAMALDVDADALSVASALFPRLGDLDGWMAPVTLRTQRGAWGVGRPLPGGEVDLAVASFVLNEALLEVPEAARAERGAALLEALFARVRPGGALIVLEPALKAESRTLSAVRDVLAARGRAPFVVAPCLHAQPCPMLLGERDWCHQELPLALPSAEARLARAAGLRFEGLSYSYLTLRHEPLPGVAATEGRQLRVVSEPLVSKGKRELFGCGDGALTRLTRLDRDASDANDAFTHLTRGDVFSLEGDEPRGEGARISGDTRIAFVSRPTP